MKYSPVSLLVTSGTQLQGQGSLTAAMTDAAINFKCVTLVPDVIIALFTKTELHNPRIHDFQLDLTFNFSFNDDCRQNHSH